MEGPSLVILKEETAKFVGHTVLEASGNSKIGIDMLTGLKVMAFKSWGKHFIICFGNIFLRIHFLMFGSYRIDAKKDTVPRLSLLFDNGEINFYTCSIKLLDQHPDKLYDWSVDVMSDEWDPAKALRTIKKYPEEQVCDVLLDQDIFAGVGNIIKNEVLFRVRLHPETPVGNISPKKLKELVNEARNYCFDFYAWKKVYALRKHWLVYKKRKCRNCQGSLSKKHTGLGKRLSFYCAECQQLL